MVSGIAREPVAFLRSAGLFNQNRLESNATNNTSMR